VQLGNNPAALVNEAAPLHVSHRRFFTEELPLLVFARLVLCC
jgi:hypothetical protein